MHHIPIEGSEEADVSWFVAQLFRNTKRPYQKNRKKRKGREETDVQEKLGIEREILTVASGLVVLNACMLCI